MLSGAFLYYVGLMATGIAPMGSLDTVMVGMGVAGIGFGAMLTAAFSVAAAIESTGARAAAVVLLLMAPIAARILVGMAFAAGPPAFLFGGATAVGLAVLAVRVSGPTTRSVLAPSGRPRPISTAAGWSFFSAVVLATGAMLAVAGADPSRLSASLFGGPLGLGGLDTIDGARAALFAIGIVLMLVGAAPLLAGADRLVRAAVGGLLLVSVAGAGIAAALARATTAGRMPDGTSVLMGAVLAVGGGLGLATGGMLVARGRELRVPALVGSAILTAACAIGWVILVGERPAPGDVAPTVLIGTAGLALGLAASALRLALTDVEPHRRGLAAGAGVVAAVIGSVLGGMIGAGEGLNTLGSESGAGAIGLVGFVIGGAAAIAVAAALPRAGHPGLRDADPRSQTPQ